jgi:hypothetical protein
MLIAIQSLRRSLFSAYGRWNTAWPSANLHLFATIRDGHSSLAGGHAKWRPASVACRCQGPDRYRLIHPFKVSRPSAKF